MNTTRSHYIVQTATAKMPLSCWGRYRRVAVLEVPKNIERASMISDHSRDVIQIVQLWDRLNVGTTGRCAYQHALAAARELCAELNQEA